MISPLLANIYLHWFDKLFHRPDGPAKWANAKLVRYADDFVVLARYQGDQLIHWVETVLESRMDLEVNRNKTKVVNLRNDEGENLDFLGFTFRYDRDLNGRPWRYLNVTPSEKALAKERDKLRTMTATRMCYKPIPALIRTINRHLEGWANYFCFGYPRMAFRHINWFVRCRLFRHLRRRSQRRYRPPKSKSFYRHLADMDLVYL